MRRRTLILGIAFGLICVGTLGTIATIGANGEALADGPKTIIYFTRHGEDHISLVDHGDGTFSEDCFPNDCCVETLNSRGELRATLLARYFREHNITKRLTHVIASHKIRTWQTVQQIAADAGLENDIDQSLDGVQQIPPFVNECDIGYEGSGSSAEPMIAALSILPAGSRVVVGAHSPTIYPIMESFGIDTSDPEKFPRRPNGKVDGFNNLWIVSVDPDGNGRLLKHVVLDFELVKQAGSDGGD